jgi:putative nucleotidyltransferase with HDIG domain
MTTLDRDQVLAHLKQLPSLPVAVADLLASFANEDVDVTSIAHQIARDQGLTARVLRVANSSFYGLQHKVGTINEAVVVLGFRAVRSMVMAVGINGVFRVDQCRGFDAQAYLRHCVAVGLGARALAAETGHNPELAFTGGILHDIGELVLAANFSQQYAEVLAYRKQHDCFLVVAERDILGMDHCEVGSLLAETWRFPSVLQVAVAEHHAPASAVAGSLADLMHVADAIAHGLGFGQSAEEMVMPVERTAWQRLGLDAGKISRVLPLIVSGVDETCQALSA